MIRRVTLLIILLLTLTNASDEVFKKVDELELYKKTQWKALLHFNDYLNIHDPKFILSEKFSLRNELRANIQSFYKEKESYANINNHAQCKFPARFLFISKELNLKKDEFPNIICPDLGIYKQKAPAERISLVYVSEKVNNPSSMMGHTFLKYSGMNYKNVKSEHAISFYTVIETINILKLTYQNIFSGMKGLFSLKPYKSVIEPYLTEENRNVWEYELNLSDYKKALIYYHIWELKDVSVKYFFTKYNCSTVIYYILSLADENIYDEKKLWITPLNTVKFIYDYNLIKSSKLIPSNEWFVKMLEENISNEKIDILEKMFETKNYNAISNLDFYSLKLLEAHNKVRYQKEEIKFLEYQNLNVNILKSVKNNSNVIDISNYKIINKIPSERQISIGAKNINSSKYSKLSFLPASHTLNDYNREYFGESELKIAYLSLLFNNKKISLDEFTLYSMKSYMPNNGFNNDLSYQFEMAIKKDYSSKINYLNYLKIGGGVGLDYLLFKDINIFFMLNSGVGYNRDDLEHIYFNPQVGAMIYEVFNMKSLIYYEPTFIKNDKVYDKYGIKHNIFLSKEYTLYFNYEKIDSNIDSTNFEFGLIKLF